MAGISVLGVYPVPEEPNVWLLEISISGFDGEIDLMNFRQPLKEGQDPDQQQVPYYEHLLDPEGRVVAGLYFGKIKVKDQIRICFFFHDLALGQPLVTPLGVCALPAPCLTPLRLAEIKYFRPFDLAAGV